MKRSSTSILSTVTTKKVMMAESESQNAYETSTVVTGFDVSIFSILTVNNYKNF